MIRFGNRIGEQWLDFQWDAITCFGFVLDAGEGNIGISAGFCRTPK